MNTLAKKITLLFLCFVTISFGHAQSSSIESAFKNAINYNHLFSTGNGEFVFQSENCSFSLKDFDNFTKSHPQYKITLIENEYRYRFGYYQAHLVTGFSFLLNDDSSCSLEQAIRVTNNNMSLKLPTFYDVQAADAFYKQYVKQHTKLIEAYKSKFNTEFLKYTLQSPNRIADFFKGCPYNSELLTDFDATVFLNELSKDPDGIVAFCNKSPYDQEFLKAYNIQDYLLSHRSEKTYVYLQKQNEGYIINNKTNYTGGIRNGLADGNGTLINDQGSWVGMFKNGKMNGPMEYKTTESGYRTKNWQFYGRFTATYQGNCINDQWDGEVVKDITTDRAGDGGVDFFVYCSDRVKLYYSNGMLQRSETISDCMSQSLDENETRYRAEIKDYTQKIQEKERKLSSSINENNIMSYVKSISYKETRNGDKYYEVYFNDGKKGSIVCTYYNEWEYHDRSLGFHVKARSKLDALVKLYIDEHL